MAQNTALFQNAANTKNTHPQRLGAPLRYGPRHYMSAYAASLRSVAPGSIFFFYATRGSAASPLHRRAIYRVGGFRPLSHHRTCELPHTAVSKLLTPVRSAQFLLPRHELLFLPCQTLARRSYPPRGHTGSSFRPSRAADYLVL